MGVPSMTIGLILAALLQAAVPTLQIVTLESVIASPQAFSGKEVVVAARVMRDEGFYIVLPAASLATTELMFVEFTGESTKSNRPTWARLLRTLKTQPNAIAVLRGRIRWSASPRFGHLNCCRFQLDVTEVLSTS